MNSNNSNYRNQLIRIFWHLDETVNNLARMAFDIGLHEEWQDLNEVLSDDDGILIRREYLEAINHPAVPRLLEMMDILEEARNSRANINDLIGDESEVEEEEYEDCDDEDCDAEPEKNDEDYLYIRMECMYEDLLILYDLLCVLDSQTGLTDEMCDNFLDKYYEGGLVIDTEDYNVRFLLKALNRVLEVNGMTEYFV